MQGEEGRGSILCREYVESVVGVLLNNCQPGSLRVKQHSLFRTGEHVACEFSNYSTLILRVLSEEKLFKCGLILIIHWVALAVVVVGAYVLTTSCR